MRAAGGPGRLQLPVSLDASMISLLGGTREHARGLARGHRSPKPYLGASNTEFPRFPENFESVRVPRIDDLQGTKGRVWALGRQPELSTVPKAMPGTLTRLSPFLGGGSRIDWSRLVAAARSRAAKKSVSGSDVAGNLRVLRTRFEPITTGYDNLHFIVL